MRSRVGPETQVSLQLTAALGNVLGSLSPTVCFINLQTGGLSVLSYILYPSPLHLMHIVVWFRAIGKGPSTMYPHSHLSPMMIQALGTPK